LRLAVDHIRRHRLVHRGLVCRREHIGGRALLQLGEVDAGIVYSTDAQAANVGAGGSVPPVTVLDIPAQYNVIAVYYIAPVKGAPHAEAARAWISYLLSDPGQAVLARYGFVRAGGP
jgi:molybdate transport system substrate-binding protein